MGTYDDASPRLRAALETADIVAAEDTRRTKALAAALGVPTPACAQAQAEAALKARLTLSLTRFVQWPGGASGDVLVLAAPPDRLAPP